MGIGYCYVEDGAGIEGADGVDVGPETGDGVLGREGAEVVVVGELVVCDLGRGAEEFGRAVAAVLRRGVLVRFLESWMVM